MARTPSTMLELDTVAPEFNLVAADGDRVNLSESNTSKAKVVAFICNHCPFVIHIQEIGNT